MTLLHSLEAIIIVRDFLKKHPQIPIVLDPVLAFKETTSLANQQYIECLVKELFPLVDLVTPNLKEAALLSGKKKISSINEVIETTKFIHTLGSKAVVVKGGSGIHGDEAIDVLYSHDGLTTFTMEKLTRSTVNGAGCTFSSAITANLVHGYTLPQAIQRSKTYVYQCILNGVEMNDQTGSVWSGGNIKGGI